MGKTQAMLEENDVFAKDENIQKKYEATKPFFNRLHREFIVEALTKVSFIGLSDYQEGLNAWQKDRKNIELKKTYDRAVLELRKQVVVFFDDKAKNWAEKTYSDIGLKNKNIEILFEEGIFKLLQKRYGKEPEAKLKEVSIFASWKGFVGYFTKFQATRRNFYKSDGTSTALATRIVDQNLKRFCDNLALFETLKEKIDFSEVEQNFDNALSTVFSLEFYNTCLLQNGIDFYNKILGGETQQNGEKKKGLNELINLHRQNTGEKLSFFKTLDKQILSEKDKFINEIEDDEGLLDTLKSFAQTAEEKTKLAKMLFADFVENDINYDLTQIYLSKEALNTISRKWTGETDVFEENLYNVLKKAKVVSSSAKKKDGGYSFPDFVSLYFFKDSLTANSIKRFWKERYYKNPGDANNKGFLIGQELVWEQFLAIFNFEFTSLFEQEITNRETGEKQIIGYISFKKQFGELLQNFRVDKKTKIIIKDFADSVLTIYQMAKYFAVEKKRAWVADYDLDVFYTHPEVGYLKFYENAYEEIVQVYNKLRNYLTKKPYSEEKWKLNFENPTLADGWDKNKESDNTAVILRKDGKYFLGIMAKGKNMIFDDRNEEKFTEESNEGKYEKVVYKFFPDQAKMFPKVCFSAKGVEFFKPSKEIWNIYKSSEFKKGDNFSVQSMQKLIDFYKDCLIKYEGWKGYDFRHLKPTDSYTENIGKFFRDVAEDGYKITFQDISKNYIDQKNESGELYLFEIHNKDWNEGATGTKNLHTLYFESLFSVENIANNFPIKINGQAEIFYRPKTEKLETKEDKQGKLVIDHKRYSENKIFFHVPLTLNRTKGDTFKFNVKINDFLANNPNINIIGVDRGEKHLAYYSVINQTGEVLESGSLNTIGDVNYGDKLEEKAKNREQARKDWQDVQGIKDLKKGYISQVVRKLADLAIQYNAIIVLEDLNMRFKQVRGGIEKSVYQQLEKALIEKLNFLVNKGEKDPEQAGHLLKAYQLSAPFKTFKDMGKQTGMIFYTQASYTSKIDPVTGWRPNLYLKYSSAKQAKIDISKFIDIKFANDRFEFAYDIKEFKKDQKEYPDKTKWTICSCVERHRWNRGKNQNKGDYDHYEDLTENFKDLFNDFAIDYLRKDIKDQISNLEISRNEKFFKDFIFYFGLVCQIRNTNDSEKAKKEGNDDFIFSPVEPFFDSRRSSDFGKNLPKNGDDNGAYNIARKGIIMLNKISAFAKQNGNCEKMSWKDLSISHIEWDGYLANF